MAPPGAGAAGHPRRGAGSDLLKGGDGEAILVGGTIAYDSRVAARCALLAEWGRTDLQYADRINHLNGSVAGGLNGPYVLTAKTVQDGAAPDTLLGGAGLDWFFARLTGPNSDTIKDWTSGEVITSLQGPARGGAPNATFFRCEPTTHRLAKKYREPTTHRLLEGPAAPPQLARELSVLRASSITPQALGWLPIAAASVGSIAKTAENSGLPSVAPVCCQPRGRSRHRLPKPPRDARQAVATDTNHYDALSVPDAGSSTMRCRKKVNDALSVRI
jgi:hypothetical protein